MISEDIQPTVRLPGKRRCYTRMKAGLELREPLRSEICEPVRRLRAYSGQNLGCMRTCLGRRGR